MLEEIFRSEWGRVIAIITKQFGDLQLAEDVASEAFVAAAERWHRDGSPRNPRAWLVATARNAAIDRLRRETLFDDRKALLVSPNEPDFAERDDLVPDERLELIFACCHPSLALEAQVALTLRAVVGLSTERISEVFLVSAETMKRRLSRAKRKISETNIPLSIPSAESLSARIDAVLGVIYLIFNEGYLQGGDIAEEALYLARVLSSLLPSEAEVHGLLALVSFLHSRARARSIGGALVLFHLQDRAAWDRDLINEAKLALHRARAFAGAGSYVLQASIEEERMSESFDGVRMLALYGGLAEVTDSPIVQLNAAVALAELGQPERALALVESLELEDYLYFHSTRGELLRRLGRPNEAAMAFQQALERSPGEAERKFLESRLADLSP